MAETLIYLWRIKSEDSSTNALSLWRGKKIKFCIILKVAKDVLRSRGSLIVSKNKQMQINKAIRYDSYASEYDFNSSYVSTGSRFETIGHKTIFSFFYFKQKKK